MANNPIEKEILSLEKQYWQALKENDVASVLRLTADPCMVTGAQGVNVFDKKALESMMKGSSYDIRDFEISDGDARLMQIGDDVAVLAYKAREEVVIDGETLRLDVAESSTWVRKNGSWVCAAHSESIAGDPFGRDRKKPS